MASKGIVEGNNYTFSAANKTITFSNDYLGMSLSDITYITNIKNGVATVIYDPFDPTKGGNFSGLTLTLAFNTTTMSDRDPLQIIVGYTPKNGDPLLVKPVDTNSTVDQTQLLQNISDNLDFLNLALDQAEGIQVNTRDVSIKKDVQGAIVPSDAAAPINYTFKGLNDQIIIDTTGYQFISITGRTSSDWSGAFNVNGSNDIALGWVQITWTTSTAASQNFISGNTYIAGIPLNISIPCNTRFIRLFISTYTSGSFTITAYLRQSPLISNGGYQSIPVNVTNSPLNATINNVTSNTTNGDATSGYNAFTNWGSTLGVSGNVRPGSTSIPYPIITGGITPPAIGSLAGIARSLIVDGSGRTVLGTDNAFLNTPTLGSVRESASAGTTRGIGGIPNNTQGAQSLTVADVAQDFGDTQVTLLRQILTELKILNQQFAEMPNLLNQANYVVSDPQEFRNDGDFDSSIQ